MLFCGAAFAPSPWLVGLIFALSAFGVGAARRLPVQARIRCAAMLMLGMAPMMVGLMVLYAAGRGASASIAAAGGLFFLAIHGLLAERSWGRWLALGLATTQIAFTLAPLVGHPAPLSVLAVYYPLMPFLLCAPALVVACLADCEVAARFEAKHMQWDGLAFRLLGGTLVLSMVPFMLLLVCLINLVERGGAGASATTLVVTLGAMVVSQLLVARQKLVGLLSLSLCAMVVPLVGHELMLSDLPAWNPRAGVAPLGFLLAPYLVFAAGSAIAFRRVLGNALRELIGR